MRGSWNTRGLLALLLLDFLDMKEWRLTLELAI